MFSKIVLKAYKMWIRLYDDKIPQMPYFDVRFLHAEGQ